MKITNLSKDNRPRERLQNQGVASLSTAELLGIILKSGTKKENVLEISSKLLAKYGLENLHSCTLQELSQEHGIGKAKACQIIALFELYNRIKQIPSKTKEIISASDIYNLYHPKLADLKQEHFIAVYLDTKNKVICDKTITKGILDASLIHPREVFHGAIKNLARSLIVIHNHPSGDPAPSEEDLFVTKKLQETSEIIGIELLDHVIIGKEAFWSWSENKHKFLK